MQDRNTAGEQSAQDPHPVTRGSKTQVVHLGLDSLYLVVEYPSDDLYRHWSYLLNTGQATYDQLHPDGIPYDGMLLKRGGNGYKLSVWDSEAVRLFLTDQVNDNLKDTKHEGQGMGVMLQLGPQWLVQHGDIIAPKQLIETVHDQLSLFGMRFSEGYRVRVNRIDIAVDVLNLRVADLSVDKWRCQWVGRASQRIFHDSAETGELETITVGSSSGSVRFKIYNKVNEATKRGKLGFWRSVWGIDDDQENFDVSRFEWTFKPHEGKFLGLQYLEELTYEGFLGLLNYGSLDWGRLCIPQADERNKKRWELAPLWKELRALIDDWTFNYNGSVKREYSFNPDIKEEYLVNLAGWLAGLMARIGIERNSDGPVTLVEALQFLHDWGFTLDWLNAKAYKKWIVMKRKAGSYDA